jgi:drug/metabolite transporter (DMT)-like permease
MKEDLNILKSISNKHVYAPFALIMATFAWGSSFIALKHSMVVFSPYFVIFCRMLIASVCFLLLRRFFGTHQYAKGDWVWLVLMSLGEPCLYFVFEAYALKYTSAGSAGVINALLPPLVAMSAWVFYRQKMAKVGILGLSIAIVASIGLTLNSTPSASSQNPVLGNILEFGAMASSCAYVMLLEKISARYSAFFLTAMQAFIGCVFFLPFALTQPMVLVGQDVHLSHIFALFYLGVFVTLGGYFLYNWGIAHIGASQSSMYVNLVPVFALLLSIWLLNERVNVWQWVSISLILLGVALTQIKFRTATNTIQTSP